MSFDFRYDNKVFSALNKFVDCIVASVLWIAGCLPIITVGTSTTALYYTVYKAIRCDRGYVGKNFWSAYRSNFKQTAKIWFMMLVILAMIVFDLHLFRPQPAQPVWVGVCYYFIVGIAFLFVIWNIFIFTYSARFENNIRDVLKNAALLAVSHLPWSLGMLLLLLGILVIVYVIPPLLFVAPAALFFVYSYILEMIYQKIIPEEGEV